MKATLLINTHTTGEINLPDEVDTGLIISAFTAIYDTLPRREYNDRFELKTQDGTSFYCEICNTYNHKWSLYVAYPGFGYNWLADFVMHIERAI